MPSPHFCGLGCSRRRRSYPRVISLHRGRTDIVDGYDGLSKTGQRVDRIGEAGEVRRYLSVDNVLLTELCLNSRKLAVNVSVEVEDLTVSIGVALKQLLFGFKLRNLCCHVCFAAGNTHVTVIASTSAASEKVTKIATEKLHTKRTDTDAECCSCYAFAGVIVFVLHKFSS